MSASSSSRPGQASFILIGLMIVLGLSGYSLKLVDWNAPGASITTGQEQPDGAEIYATRCMSCHQMNGAGVPGVFPPLDGAEWVTEDKGQLIRIILNGVTGPMEVKGETYSGAMPPWGSFLNDEEMAELLTYVRTSWNNDAEEITPEEVQKVRAAVQDRKEPWTAEELEDPANQGIPGEEATDGEG